jgi:hypothetical protein
MKIPIFVSAPTALSDAQETSRRLILRELEHSDLEWRALGRSDYPTELPLREVLTIARHCAGGLILGFSQFRADTGVWKSDTPSEKVISAPINFPTPWNQLEAGILFALGFPLLVFKESNISGGVFDNGVTDVFIHQMPAAALNPQEKKALHAVFLKWQAAVRNYYYGS